MDPDAALDELLDAMHRLEAYRSGSLPRPDFDDAVVDAMNAVESLAAWRAKGGFLPSIAPLTPLPEPEPVATPTTEGEGGDG